MFWSRQNSCARAGNYENEEPLRDGLEGPLGETWEYLNCGMRIVD